MTNTMKQTVIKNPTWWKRRSALERGLTVIAVSGTLLCIALAISIGVIVANSRLCDSETAEALHGESPKVVKVPKNMCTTPACINAASQIINNMNDSVAPCDDFYKFACGSFLQKTLIPDDKVSVNTFSVISDQVQEQLRKSIEEPLMPDENKPIRLVKNLYKSCMDKKAIEEQGVKPLLKILEELGGWPVLDGDKWNESDFHWIESVYKFRDMGFSVDYFIDFSIGVDLKNSTKRVIDLDQPSLGLSREFLVEGMNPKIVKAYQRYMIDIAVLLGAQEESAAKELTESLEFEKTLANISLPKEKRRNVTLLHNPMTIKELSEKYPSIPWKEYFNRLLAPMVSVNDDEIIIVNVPNYISEFEKLMQTTPRRIQANYIMWRVAAASVSYLNEDIRKRQLEYSTELSGRTEREARWKECVDIVAGSLSLSVGSLYIKKYFNEDAKKNAVEMVQDIRNEFNQILKKVDWMDEDTRKSALDKAASMSAHIAYPDELLEDEKLEEFYQNLELSGDSYLKSMLNLSLFGTEYSFGELRKPINKSDWKNHGRSAIVNAFYSSIENSIQFPAAILQGRFFDNNCPKYMNYGAIGFVIGHEITHGFDDQGRQFDKHGNLIDWWAPSTKEKYLRKAQCIIHQYGNYTDSEVGLHLNGINTQGENIADNGGIKVAYLAYKEWASRNGEEQTLPGLDYTPQQLFWISAANTWCAKYRPETLKLRITTGYHSPGEFRILGPFSNMIDFAKDFKCAEGTKMNPKNKCAVWDSSWWNLRSPMERGLIVTTFFGVLLCIALAIGFGVIMSNRQSCNSETDKLHFSSKVNADFDDSSNVISSKNVCYTSACLHAAHPILKNMDRRVHPCNDFFKFACGNFLKKTTIPDEKTHVNSFTLIEDQLREQLSGNLEAAVKPDDHKHIRLVKNLYKSCTDRNAIEEQGVEPLLKMLKELGGWPVLEGDKWNESDFHWMQSVYKFRDMGLSLDYFIRFRVRVDLKDSTRRIISLDQASFGLAREFLVQGISHKLVRAYYKYMVGIAILLGAPVEAVKRELTNSLKFEKTLAEMSLSTEHRRAMTVLHNPMTIKAMSKRFPSIPWKDYFNRLLAPMASVDDDEIIIVNVPNYISGFEKLVNTTPPRVQANYVMWRVVAASISYLSENLRQKQLEFATARSGKIASEPRWKECVHIVTHHLSFGVSSIYIKQYFNEDAKRDASEIVDGIKNKFTTLLQQVDWMDEQTRESALLKATSMSAHIGYPDELLDDEKLEEFYQDLELSGNSYLESMLNVTRFNTAYSIGGLKKPFNKTDWKNRGDAAKVTAFYSPLQNSIQIPAGILRGRFFNNERPKYMNYGGIGFVVGHELIHGFDSRGRQYDTDGNLIDWWAPSTMELYLRKVQCIINQYRKYYVPEVELHINGDRTRDENIADNGGLKVAYLAYKKWVSKHRKEKSLPGLNYTPNQMFWISAANIWCVKFRPEQLKLMMIKDSHSPAEFRVLGPFSNNAYLARDFKCMKGTKMNPKKKCAVW